MPTVDEMKKEILSNVTDKSLISQVKEELDLLEESYGLGKNNLEAIYDVWRHNRGKMRGRSNRSNSWIMYATGLTTAKPSEPHYKLRRSFVRPEPPDVDTDFEDHVKPRIIEYMAEKYGELMVAQIGTYQGMKERKCLRYIMKSIDVADAFHKGHDQYVTMNEKWCRDILDSLPKGNVMKVTDESGETKVIKSIRDAYKYIPDFRHYMDKYPDVMKYSANIEGVLSQFGTHASGVVVSVVPLGEICPTKRVSDKASDDVNFPTQYDLEDVSEIGLIKFDILGLATLNVVKETLVMIKDSYDIDIDIAKLPLDDKKTLRLFKKGDMAGVFQCEGWGMRDTVKKVGVDSFDDIMAALALYRPGPMDSIPEYCARKHGHNKVDYFHASIEPFVKPYLERTYGILVYQEQVMQICNSLAGFSVTDAYMMIKAIGKKKANLMKRYYKEFVRGLMKNKVPQDVAEQYWDKFITPFSSYGFNASHSCAYAYLAYTTAYLKANFPDEFACSVLNINIERAKHDKIVIYEKDLERNMNVKFLPRVLNNCAVKYQIAKHRDEATGIRKTEIRPSLICKGVGKHVAQEIHKKGPYKSIQELSRNTDAIVTVDAIKGLVDAGFFKGKKGVENKEVIIREFKAVRADMKKGASKGVDTSEDMFADD